MAITSLILRFRCRPPIPTVFTPNRHCPFLYIYWLIQDTAAPSLKKKCGPKYEIFRQAEKRNDQQRSSMVRAYSRWLQTSVKIPSGPNC